MLSNGPFPLSTFSVLLQEIVLGGTPGFGLKRGWQHPSLALEENPSGKETTLTGLLPGSSGPLWGTLGLSSGDGRGFSGYFT